MSDHIVKAFDEEIDDLNRKIVVIAKSCQDQLARATQAFQNLDRELARQVIADDENINRMQREFEEESVRILARRAPVAVDLRHLLAGMRIAAKIERIADYAANIAKQVADLSQEPDREVAVLIIDMAGICRDMLSDAIDAFLELDTDKAIAVWERDDEVDRKFARMMRLVRRQMQDEESSIADGTELIFIGRFCERIGDHITNISEDIYYTKTGQSYIGTFEAR